MSENEPYTINSLRGDLASTIRQLRDGDANMTIEKAKAIGDLAQTMINSAKVEVDMARALGAKNMKPTGFMAIEGTAEKTRPVIEGGATQDAPRIPAPRDNSPTYGTRGQAPIGSL